MSKKYLNELTEADLKHLRAAFNGINHGPISWDTASEDVKKRFPEPPKREDFDSEEAYGEAASGYFHTFSRIFPHAVQNDRWKKFLADRTIPDSGPT